jgi:broad specificity phosphatase PhoE
MTSVSARIVLVRHGRTSCASTGWLDAAGFRRWTAAYEAAGLASGETPPPALRALASEAGRVVTSNLPRARDSARLLAPCAEIIISHLLREPPLQVPPSFGPRLPLAIWLIAAGLGWRFQVSRSEEPLAAARHRAREAAEWLAALATEESPLIAVTHGVFRRLLQDALRARGWRGRKGQSHDHWSAWTLTQIP